MKALIATDGSDLAIQAAEAAEQLLHQDVEFVLVTVIPEPEDPLAMAGGFEGPLIDEEEAEEITEAAEESGRKAILETARHIHEPMRARLLHDDDPGPALCALAEQQEADVVVIGASEKGLLQRFLEGSVMRYVIKHAPCPVLLVRHD